MQRSSAFYGPTTVWNSLPSARYNNILSVNAFGQLLKAIASWTFRWQTSSLTRHIADKTHPNIRRTNKYTGRCCDLIILSANNCLFRETSC